MDEDSGLQLVFHGLHIKLLIEALKPSDLTIPYCCPGTMMLQTIYLGSCSKLVIVLRLTHILLVYISCLDRREVNI